MLGYALPIVNLLNAFFEISPNVIKIDLFEARWILVAAVATSIPWHLEILLYISFCLLDSSLKVYPANQKNNMSNLHNSTDSTDAKQEHYKG